MHPPFFHTDHRSVVHTPEHRSHSFSPRRTTPVVLPVTLSHMTENPFIPTYLVEDITDETALDQLPVRLRVVPAPSHWRLRDVIGRWLIRLGQRMMVTDHPG